MHRPSKDLPERSQARLVTPVQPVPVTPEGRAGVIVPTHNDGQNIGPLLDRLLAEPCVGEVLVIASACADDTVPSVLDRAGRADGRVRLYVEAERSGKPAAVNFGLEHTEMPVVIVVSGDVLPEPGTIRLLVEAVERPGVGLAGGRPVPVNPQTTAVGHATHLLWRLHHRLALRSPKIGEVIAMRSEAAVPLPMTSVDEPCFQAMLQGAGWKPAYVPEALIANRGPGTARDFVKQRRQVHTGNLWLKRREGYTVPSLHPALLAAELWRDLLDDPSRRRPVRLAWTAGAVAMESWARLLARYDYTRGRENRVWGMVDSAKAPALGPDRMGAGNG